VDTPGFDDTYRSDTDVLREIAAWLTDSYSNQVKLKGIIYLYRIMDERMQGSAKRNLFMFKKLCGPKPLNNVNLATTTWSSVNPARPWDVITGAGDRHEEVVKLLLKKDTDLKSRDNMGRTPLRADVIAKNRDGWTPLHLAAYNRHEAVVRLLLEQYKANANARDWLAAKKGHGVVQPLLEQCRALAGLEKALGPDHTLTLDTVNNLGVLYTEKYRLADVNAKKSDGWTALHLAAKNGHEMELEYKGRRYGETPLLWAARNGHEVVVKLLLEKGAELESKSSNGQPLSYIAALQTLEGHSNRVRTLINNGVARSTTSHWTIWRAEFGGLQVLSYLIRQTGSLSLKSLLTLGTFFASPVLADTPGSGSSDRNWQNISSLIKHMDQVRKTLSVIFYVNTNHSTAIILQD
jgi:ankyrin repeat protein